MMGQDELATVRTLEAYRALMAELISRYSGRVVDSPGDNVLAEFASVVDAVVGDVAAFLRPVLEALLDNSSFELVWVQGGPYHAFP